MRPEFLWRVIKLSQRLPPALSILSLETDGVYRAPGPGRFLQRLHHLDGQQFMWNGQIDSDEPHRLSALQREAQICRRNLECQIPPIES